MEFDDSYIPTIESFHKKIFKIRGEIFRLDILGKLTSSNKSADLYSKILTLILIQKLDTSGNDPFPAIKKLNIMTGK